jgi:hypothetical protein
MVIMAALAAAVLFSGTALSQDSASVVQAFGAQMMGGLGITTVDGKLYYRVQLVPEIAVYKLGIGLDGDILFNQDGIRKEDWNPSSRWVRVIRYLRWGQKRDRFYIRVGALDAATLGHGFIMYRYANQAANDADRKLGMELDTDFGLLGLETVVSNFGRAEIYGGRGYVRPLRGTGIPIIKGFEMGTTVVGDVDPDQGRDTDDGVTVFGFDLGLPLINTSLLYTGLYYDFGKIDKLGHGNVVGIGTDIRFPGNLFTISAKLEQRFLGKRFVAQYFDRFYEVERFQPGPFPLRKSYLVGLDSTANNGTYGELAATLIGKLDILGSYQYTYQVPKSGILHLGAKLPDLIPKVELVAAYDHKGIGEFGDMGKQDENFLVTVEGGYEVYSHVMLYLTYLRSYELRNYDQDNNPLPEPVYKPVEKFSPRLAVKFKF